MFRIFALLVCGATFVGLTIDKVSAADLPSPEPQPAPMYAAPVFSWTGFYLGGNVGYSVARDPSTLAAPFFPALGSNLSRSFRPE
jgi:opacity protein-like surface antigen